MWGNIFGAVTGTVGPMRVWPNSDGVIPRVMPVATPPGATA